LHDDQIGRAPFVMGAALMIAIPALFILRQPNLGTATILMVMGATVMFMAGVHRKYFMFVALMVFSLAPLGWSMLHAYQKQRVLTFLDPEADPLGSGYNIIQSKIAIGSGGFFGKGYLQGSQGQLDFLPEKQTDFIFTMLAEEFGFIGSVGLLLVYLLLLIYGLAISVRSKHRFGALIGVGFTTLLFLHLFINVAMVMGMLPVVGVPLPLMSYGGSMMLTVLAGFGLLLNVYVNRDQSLGRAVGNRI
jgi:rod shape determining protein RodA